MSETNTANINTSSANVSLKYIYNHSLKPVAMAKRRHEDLKDDVSAPPEFKENFNKASQEEI